MLNSVEPGVHCNLAHYHFRIHTPPRSPSAVVRLQDFEALTPNLLARTMETVEGGGIVVMLLSNLSSLRDLYTLTMDMHSRLRTPAHGEVKGEAY
jgi:tRNA(Met) C34 N-acetyltransferase TmcA